jgi:nucleotide-binding universal stress UspA family protein
VIKETKGYKTSADYSKPPEQTLSSQPVGGGERGTEDYLAVTAKKMQDEGIKVDTKVLLGKPAQAIIFHAEHNSCDLIVMAGHGRGPLGRWLRGSVANKVFRGCCTPVLMVRGPGCIPVTSRISLPVGITSLSAISASCNFGPQVPSKWSQPNAVFRRPGCTWITSDCRQGSTP